MPYSSEHLPQWMLELHAEDMLSPGERSKAEAHLRSCVLCSAELDASRALNAALAQLPTFDPSPGFADAVMSRVVLPQTATAPEAGRARRWLPGTRRGWTLLGAALLVPIAPLAAFLAWLLSNPLVSVGGLWSMSSTWIGEAAWSLVVRGAGAAIDTGAFTVVAPLMERMPEMSSGEASAVALLVAVVVPASSWALIRLLRTPKGGFTHAH